MKDSMEPPEKYMASLLKIISQKNPQLADQVEREIKECWEVIGKAERSSLGFLRTVHLVVSGAFQNKVLDLRNEQDWPGLIAHCEHWLEVEPNKVLACYNIAFAHKEMCSFQEAIQAYHKVIGCNPAHLAAFQDLGEIHGVMERFEESVEAYSKALNIRPDDVKSWYCLSIAYEKQGQIEEAKEARRKANHFESDEVAGIYNQAVIWALKGNLPAAYNAVLEIKKCDPQRANKLMEYIISLDG